MKSIIISILTMGCLGAFFAYGLSIARNKFKVEEDPRIDDVEEALAGANCGGCGFAGCRAFAEAVVAGKAEPFGCPVGGNDTAAAIARIMGMELQESTREVAVLMCRGTTDAAGRKAEYQGIHTCYAANIIQRGDKICSYGCLGYGDCVTACNFDAIKIGPQGIPVIDRDKCTACGLCVKACPNHLLELHPADRTFYVLCKSQDDGKTSRAACKNACIGCKICTRGAANGEIVVENFLSEIKDPKIAENEEAMQWIAKCPTKCIGFLDQILNPAPPAPKPQPKKEPEKTASPAPQS
jgi:RnfABCDGE-type electron transport complex B subunit